MRQKKFYVSFFEFVARNADICRIIIKSGTGAFLSRALESGRYKVLGDMSKLFPACPTSKIDYYYVFVSNGFMGLLQYWLNNGMRYDIGKQFRRLCYLAEGLTEQMLNRATEADT